MFLIAGLGNPGAEYVSTRHNMGFCVIDELSDRHSIKLSEEKFHAKIGKGMIGSEKVILVKPLTYMNASGEALQELLHHYKIPLSDLIVLCDDIYLAPGRLRVRKNGSDGGHNGLKNIIALCGGTDFMRIRIGVGEKPPQMDLKDFVLSHYTSDEKAVFEKAFQRAASATELLIEGRIEEAMNTYNAAEKQ